MIHRYHPPHPPADKLIEKALRAQIAVEHNKKYYQRNTVQQHRERFLEY